MVDEKKKPEKIELRKKQKQYKKEKTSPGEEPRSGSTTLDRGKIGGVGSEHELEFPEWVRVWTLGEPPDRERDQLKPQFLC